MFYLRNFKFVLVTYIANEHIKQRIIRHENSSLSLKCVTTSAVSFVSGMSVGVFLFHNTEIDSLLKIAMIYTRQHGLCSTRLLQSWSTSYFNNNHTYIHLEKSYDRTFIISHLTTEISAWALQWYSEQKPDTPRYIYNFRNPYIHTKKTASYLIMFGILINV